eukprot:m.205882 g.205882  ORF g.205882 m.205882 type:complete len:237 (+) comp18492_c1_seq6:80-790(+)
MEDVVTTGMDMEAAYQPGGRGGHGGGRGRSMRGGGGGRGRGRGAGRRRDGPAAAGDDGHRLLKVAAGSQPKIVAGSVAHICREQRDGPVVLASGMDAINQSVKALAIARKYLIADEIDIRALVEFQSQDSTGARMQILKSGPIPLLESDELTIKRDSDPYKVAGAVAGRIREGKQVSVTALGPEPVFRAIETIAISRRYLKGNGTDVAFSPEFYDVPKEGGSVLSGLRFMLFASAF